MTNADFEKIVDTSDEWITTRTGIKERRIADDSTACSDMAVEAGRRALESAGLTPEDIDLVITGTVTPDYRLPSTACVVQEKMGLSNAVAFDVVSACTGFINAVSIANSYIETGVYKHALTIGVEKLSSIVNYKDRATCVLFGDAAGAAVLGGSSNGSGLLSSYLKSDGRLRELLWMPVGGTAAPLGPEFAWDGSDKVLMAGSDVFKVAVREMCRAGEIVLERAGITGDDLALVIPHQANIRIIEALARRLKVGMDRVYVNIERFGNTSSASVPMALDEAYRTGRIKDGDHVLMVAFGGGLIWGAALIKW